MSYSISICIHLFCLDTNFSILDNHISDTSNIRFLYPNTKLSSFRLNPGDFGSVGDFAASSELAFGGVLREMEWNLIINGRADQGNPFFKILDDPIVGGVKDIFLGGWFFRTPKIGEGIYFKPPIVFSWVGKQRGCRVQDDAWMFQLLTLNSWSSV